MSSEVFAGRLRELREEKELSIRQLGAILNISHVAISYYENNKRVPDIMTAKKFADYFNTTCDYLIGLTDERYRKG
jgi:transcriptional regulator with XRE-family HTH domain